MSIETIVERLKNLELWIKVAVFFAFLSFCLAFLCTTVADPDLWGYMSFGRLFWSSKTFPYQDVFSYVPTLNPWVYHEWLTGVVFYPLYQALGAPGLQILKYGLAVATLGLIYRTALIRGAQPLAAALFVALIALEVRGYYNPVRAQVFTFGFFALSLLLLERARLSHCWRGLYLLPVIQIPWCNLHGGFLAGLGLIALYLAGEMLARRPFLPYLLALILSLLATLLNPYGLQYWEYLLRAITMPRPHITEWASIFKAYQHGIVNLPVFIALLAAIVVALLGGWQSRRREITASLALGVTLILGLNHIRHLSLFWILAGAYLPVCLNVNLDYLKSRPILRRLWGVRGIKIGALAFLAIFTMINSSFFATRNHFELDFPTRPISQKIPGRFIFFYPVEAVAYLKKQGISGRILPLFAWGEYLIWELYPRCLIGFDGRYETVYPREVQEKYFEFLYGRRQWRRFLEDYPTDLILLDKSMEVVKLIQNDPHWRLVYSDSNCVLFKSNQN